MFYAGDELYDDDVTSGPADDGYDWTLPPEASRYELEHFSAPLTDDVPVDYADERAQQAGRA